MSENEMSDSCKVRVEALDAYLHGMLNDAQQRELNAHLLVCPQCNRTLSALEAEIARLEGAPKVKNVVLRSPPDRGW